MVAARDTTREISETAQDFKDRGVIKDTIAIAQTTAAVRNIGKTARDTVQQVGESVPLPGEKIRKVATVIKTGANKRTQ
jgi:hypothetical protein